MHFGSNNIKATYEMNDKFSEEVTEERDLGVIMNVGHKPLRHYPSGTPEDIIPPDIFFAGSDIITPGF